MTDEAQSGDGATPAPVARKEVDRAAVSMAVVAGRAINAGARVTFIRMQNPAKPDEGILVYFDDDESAEITAAVKGVLTKRVAI